ncbi:hypothetical protein Mal15_33010 [Stieleria maiorica]|uniref:Uncharacterized protein n=1 Tax=Stieleria maiorica TaxID=2795974 RepID=A0A5B9MFC8_9BACT|nr:hypothetical protein [Stieleria maiorica]QEF99239.1 hypothetical protein Mal15_33010 [Stieleria maiorica]
MKFTFRLMSLLGLVVVLAGCGGTSDPSSDSGGPTSQSDSSDHATSHDHHGHPEHGPHGGDLVELGKEAYHAELVHGEDGIMMYVLDGSASKQVPIAAEKLMLSLKHDGQVASFDLAADPDSDDPPGQSSRFNSADEKLHDWLDAGAEGAVVIEIDGKSYTGNVAHDHDHAGHDHAGHDHAGHDHADAGHE